jgi:hypothetical protein
MLGRRRRAIISDPALDRALEILQARGLDTANVWYVRAADGRRAAIRRGLDAPNAIASDGSSSTDA